MNIKRIFGALLTLLGIGGLLYSAITFISTAHEAQHMKTIISVGVLGIIFFVSGIGLIRVTKDES